MSLNMDNFWNIAQDNIKKAHTHTDFNVESTVLHSRSRRLEPTPRTDY